MNKRAYIKPELHRSIRIRAQDYHDLKLAAIFADMPMVELVHLMIVREAARQKKNSSLAIKRVDTENKHD